MQTRTILIAGITAASFATPALADYFPPPPPRVAQAPAPVVAGPAYPAPVSAAPCFWQGRAFSNAQQIRPAKSA
jgi:hypothetical protein